MVGRLCILNRVSCLEITASDCAVVGARIRVAGVLGERCTRTGLPCICCLGEPDRLVDSYFCEYTVEELGGFGGGFGLGTQTVHHHRVVFDVCGFV